MRYVKIENGSVVEYSGPSLGGDRWYTADWWIPYAGELPVSRLSIVDGAVIELPAPELPRMISKLALKRVLAELGAWDEFKAAIAAAGYAEDFDLAVNLSTDDPAFAAALPMLAELADHYDITAEAIISDCIWEG